MILQLLSKCLVCDLLYALFCAVKSVQNIDIFENNTPIFFLKSILRLKVLRYLPVLKLCEAVNPLGKSLHYLYTILRPYPFIASYFWTPVYPSIVIALVCLLVRPSVFKYPGDRSLAFSNFGPQVYPKGSLVIALVRVSVCVSVRL